MEILQERSVIATVGALCKNRAAPRIGDAIVCAPVFSLLLCLVGCQGSGAGRGGEIGQIVFVDVAGNQMVVDVAGRDAGDADAADSRANGPLLEDIPTDTASSADGLSWAGEVYEDAESFEARVKDRSADRFFVVPDGSGSTQTLTAELLGAGGVPVGGVHDADNRGHGPPLPQAHWIQCAEPVALALLPAAMQRQHNLVFPVIEKGLRYAGYRVPLPEGVRGVSVWSYIRKGRHVDALLASVGNGGDNITAVIDNIATETVPESMFRYGSVGGRVLLASATTVAPAQLAVLDGTLVRGSAPVQCWPSIPPNASALLSGEMTFGGAVTLEFSGGRGE